MPDETEGFAPEPGPELDLGIPAAEPQDDLPWPPWLENLGTIGRVRAIVAAVADCAREHMHSPAVGEPCTAGQLQHCTVTMAVQFLLKLIAGDDGPAQTLAEASEAMLPAVGEPPLPGGEYARVEIMGHDEHTGWVTESTRAGQPVMVVRDWDGFVIAEVPGHSLYRFVPLATPLKRPDAAAETRRALPAGAAHDVHDGFGDRDGWDGEGPW